MDAPAPSRQGMDKGHLDLLELDTARAGELDAERRAHLDGCARCRRELDTLVQMTGRIRLRSVAVPEEVDRAVLAAAARRLGRKPLVPALALAAALLVAVGLAIFLRDGEPADVDGSGRIDIVDAYVLALRLERGEAVDERWDVTGDGKVDQSDVDEIARLSVAVGGSR